MQQHQRYGRTNQAFGNVSNTTGQFVWNDQGENCTINELMNNAWNAILQLLDVTAGVTITPPTTTTTQPTYFSLVELAGGTTSPFAYEGLVPLVAIYKINYPAYYNATGTTGTG